MSATAIIDALVIPAGARVDQRVPKKILLEQGAPTPADKRHIQDGIDELFWAAALKPSNIGVSAYRDEAREYLEVAVLTAMLRPEAKAVRLLELIHRAIPYPLILIATQGNGTTFSLAHKRFSQAELSQFIVDGIVTSIAVSSVPTKEEASFLGSLAVAEQPARDLFTLYQGWFDRVGALEAARLTGCFILYGSPDRAAQRRAALNDHTRLMREMAALRTQASSEKQLNRRVDLNLQLKRLEMTLAELMQIL